MTEEERGIILHSLGLAPRGQRQRRWSYRNHYADRDPPRKIIKALIAAGYMQAGRLPEPGYPYRAYYVTNAGAIAAGVLNRVRREDRL